jgi:hypothetical protein
LVHVEAFQRKHKIDLPPDYIRFVTEFGNGTTDNSSVFALGMTLQDDGDGPPIPFAPSVVDALSQAFAHGLAMWPGDDCADEIDDYIADNGMPPPTFDPAVMPGALPVAYRGCGEWCYLSLAGPDAGLVWEFANGWLCPVPTPWLRPVNFCEWIVGEVALQRGLRELFLQLTAGQA